MVEVFATNVKSQQHEQFMLKILRSEFPEYMINFDLEDCDNILRIETKDKVIDAGPIITLASSYGVEVQVLPDIPLAKIHEENKITYE